MRKRSVLLVILGLTACICWAIGSAVADQPGNRAASSVDAQPAAKAAKSAAGQTSDKPVPPANKLRPDLQAPVHVGGSMPVTQGSSGVLSPRDSTGTPAAGIAKTALDPSRIHAVPANLPRQVNVVDAAAGTDGSPRDTVGVCLPAGGVCGPIVYKNMEQEYFRYYYDATADVNGTLDDIWLAGTDRDLCSIIVWSMSPSGTYSFSLEIWTDCPLTAGAQRLYGPVNSGTLQGGENQTEIALPGVTVPTFFYIKTIFTNGTSTQAGPLIAELAEVGFTADSILVIEGTPLACNSVWFGGGPTAAPWSGWGYQISAAGTATGKCCYNSCAACVDTTYSDCMARAGNPEFRLGTTCAEAPSCGKGACCLTTGACVANKTQTECQALANYLSWQLGSDCTAHGQIPQADCAPVPSNDLCANAISLSGTCVTIAYNSRNATLTAIADDPPTCLQDAADPNNNVPVANDIWYKYDIPSTYNGTAVTSAKVIINTLGSKYDTLLAVYAKNFAASPAYACGNDNAVKCSDVNNTNLIACNDDTVGLPTSTFDPLHEQIQASFVTVTCDGGAGPLPGGCLLIRVGGLNQTGNTPGGPGVLNIDFIPTGPQPTFYSSNGVCCMPNGTCVLKNSGPDCTAAGGFYRSTTDFYENGNPAAGFEASAPGCCHGEFSSCQVGEYCGNPIVINPGVLSWAGNVHRVSYFKFTTRDFRAGDPGYPGADPHYALTIDTCGSDFDTVLSVYKGPYSSFPFTESGDCDDPGALVARNDNCSLDTPGADGRVSCASLEAITSCVCLTVGSDESSYNLMAGNEYYIAVGKKDSRLSPQRAMGIDPVPNYPIDSAAVLAIHINDGWANCSSCTKQCCKADMDGNGTLDALDIAGFISVLCSTTPLSCQDVTWCRANMNGDAVVDVSDIPAFVSALLAPWPCDQTNYCNVAGYCQLPDQPTGAGGIVSDMNTTIANKTADNFVSLDGGQITRVCWWGLYSFRSSGGWGPCTVSLPTDNFAIRFYSNADNRPGTVLASYSGITLGAAPYNLTKTATGRQVVQADEYKYEVQIPPVAVAANECVWMEIVNNTGSANCWWLWETMTATTTSGDNKAAQWQYGYYRTVADTDLAFCVNIPLWGPGCVQYCTVKCPTGGIAEGEPVCSSGYVDSYNAGCNMAPGTEMFTNISNGKTICGTSGVYPSITPGYVERDTDWYKLVLTGTADWHVVLTGKAEFTMVLGLLEYAQNAGSGNCADLSGYITGQVGRCTNLILDTWLAPGTWYIFVAPDFNDPFYPDCGAKYTLNAVVTPCTTYTNCLTTAAQPERCPGGTGHTAESETCGQHTNDGCNAPDPNNPVYTYGSITAGSKICGTVYANAGTRDTDWYQFTLTTPKLVKATLKSEFPGVVMLLKVNNCATFDLSVITTAYSSACSSATAQETLDIGTYVVFVGPGDANGGIFNCIKCTDLWNDYDLHMVWDPPVICTAGTYCQDWHNAPSAYGSDKYIPSTPTVQIKIADNFKPTASGTITHVCWWGITNNYSGTAYTPCTMTTANFNVAFHLDNATTQLPNTAAYQSRVLGNVTGTATGGLWGTSPIYLWQADLATSVTVTAGNKYWITIYNTTGPTCSFLWFENVPGPAAGDDYGARHNGTAWTRVLADFAWCVNIACDANVFGRPANDEPAGAITMTIGTLVNGDNTYATQGLNDPGLSCAYDGAGTKANKTVWYKFVAPASGNVTLQTCTSVTPFSDSILAIFSGTPAALTEVGCDEDGCTGASPYYSKLVKTGLTAGTTYYVEVGTSGAYTTSVPGAFKLTSSTP